MDIFPEDLEARSIECLLLTVTTNCNLRCTYCCVSQPWYIGQNLDISRLDHFISELSDYKVGLIQVNGHGETTTVEGWEKFCQKLLQQGYALCITSNFARLFTSDELQVLASMRFIIISIDTVNRELLRRIRRAVKLENILSNMKNIQNRAKAEGLPPPFFVWQCVLSDAVAPYLEDFIQFGRSVGVRKFSFGNLIGNEPLREKNNPICVQHPAKMQLPHLIAFMHKFGNLLSELEKDKVGFEVEPGIVEGMEAALRAHGWQDELPYIPRAY